MRCLENHFLAGSHHPRTHSNSGVPVRVKSSKEGMTAWEIAFQYSTILSGFGPIQVHETLTGVKTTSVKPSESSMLMLFGS